MLKPQSLFTKILLSHIIVIIITISFIGIVLSHLVSEYLIDAKKNQLINDGTVIAGLLENKAFSPETADYLAGISKLTGVRMWIVNDKQEIIGDCPMPWRNGRIPANGTMHMGMGGGMGMHNNHMGNRAAMGCAEPPATQPTPAERQHRRRDEMEATVLNGEVASWIRKAPNDDDPSIIVAVPINSKPAAALFLYTPIFGITKTADTIQTLLIYTSIAAIIAAVLAALFIAKSLTKPISEIARAAGEFAKGDYQSRAKIKGSDEIATLGHDFNNMAQVLEQTELNRREFFANVTHELKTPIASIQLLSETILDGMAESPETHDRYLTTIIEETHHMNHLISELLDLEKLESASFSFNFSEVNLRDFQTELQQKLTPLLEKKELHLEAVFNGSGTSLYTDAFRLEQIITNLLSNAIRHSEAGAVITLEYTLLEQAVIRIIDHGEGIPAEHLPHIWERFYRVDKARSRADGGTGLGLSITKKLCEGLGGTIAVNSVPHQETIFTITMPLKK